MASILGGFALGLGGWAWVERQRAIRMEAVGKTVARATDAAVLQWGEARAAAVGDLTKWNEAKASLDQAQAALAAGEAGPATIRQVSDLQKRFDGELDEAKKRALEADNDRLLLERLEHVRSVESETWDFARTDREYGEAFRAAGIDPAKLESTEVQSRLSKPSLASEVGAALDHWALARRRKSINDPEGSRRLTAAARLTDDDPWRDKLRDAIESQDLSKLQELANDPEAEKQTAASLVLLGRSLADLQDPESAVNVLKAARRRFPNDLWVNLKLAHSYNRLNPPNLGEAIRYYTTAEAVKPNNLVAHTNMGLILIALGRIDEGIHELNEVTRLAPNMGVGHFLLGNAYLQRGLGEQAVAELRRAKELPIEDPEIGAAISALLPQAEQLTAMTARLKRIIDGKDTPANPREWLAFAQFAYDKGLYAGALRLAERGLEAEPSLAEVTASPLKYNGACSAVLLAMGKAKDQPSPDDEARAGIRSKALVWLQADIAAWAKLLEAKPELRTGIGQRVQQWKQDADLVGIREKFAIEKLPKPEQEKFRKLWADVDNLIKRCNAKP